MIDQVGASLRALGVEGSRIHAEHFSVATAAEGTGRAAATASPAAAPTAALA
jgi:ferredoxin-NADP reductase